MNDNLDGLYVLWVLEETSLSDYMLAKKTKLNNMTIARIKNFKHSLSWKNIRKIENVTGFKFRSQEHIQFATKFELTHPELFKD